MLNICPLLLGAGHPAGFWQWEHLQPCSAWHHRGNSAFPLPGGCPQCSQPMPADWLPDCCICTPFCHQWVQVGPGFVCGDWLHLPTCWKGQGLLGWSICILWLLPPPQPRPRLKQRKSQRSPTRIWDSVSLTNHQKAANPASIICEMRK